MNRMIRMAAFITFIFSASILFAQNDIPSSSRSREAINRVGPGIAKELADKDIEYAAPIFIRIFKSEMTLEVWLRSETNYKLFRRYPICTYGSGGLGPKIREGDGKAPEGFYFVTPSLLNPVSRFHLSFNLGYPNSYDRHHGRTGSALMVHGSCVSIGCYAMTDSGIEEIFTLANAALRNGQSFFRVHIFPFKMNNENMQKHKGSEWYDFWSNLKEGYDFFETNNRIPPNVEVRGGRYVIDNQ
jgi:murein L,D-transpeptidase YafK